MNKKSLKKFSKWAELLPEQTYKTFHVSLPSFEHTRTTRSVINPVNHYRRIKRAYKRGGIDAVKFYFKLQGVEFVG